MSKKFAPATNKFNLTKLSLGEGPLRGLQSLLSYVSMDLIFGPAVEGKFSNADQKIFAELVKKLCPTKVQVSELLMQDNLQKTPLFKLKMSNGASKPSVFVLLSKREFELLRSIVVDAILGLVERRDYMTMDISERKQHQIWYFAACSVFEQLAKEPKELEFLRALPPCFWSVQSMEHIEQCFTLLREKNDDDTWLANWITNEEFFCTLCDSVSSFPECESKGADTSSVCPNCFGAVDIKGIGSKLAPLVGQTH
jgi:hypothetical protein